MRRVKSVMPSPARASLHRSAAIAPAGQSRDADEDDARLIRRPRCAIAEERSVPRPARWTVPPLEAISKDLAFETGFDEAMRLRPSASFLDAGDSRVCRGPLISFAIAG